MIKVTLKFESVAEMCRVLGAQGAEAAIRQDPQSIAPQLGAAVDKAANEMSEESAKALRDAVKAELDGMGVKYNARCATETLQQLLQAEKAKATAQTAAPAAPAPKCVACGDTGKNSKGGDCVCVKKATAQATPAADTAPATTSPAGMITLKDVLERAKRFAALVGGGEGVRRVEAIVATFGVKKISEVPGDYYPELMRMLSEEPVKHQQATPAADTAPATTSPAGMITLKDVLERAKRFAALVGGGEGVRRVEAMVATFGVKKISEVPGDRYPELMRMLSEETVKHQQASATSVLA